jgi:hypothetical protein
VQSASFIKIDVEGNELHVLDGAKRIISEQKPKIAIALYHWPSHLYKIPNKIKTLNKDYRFKLRHHSGDFYESILYAY